MSHSFYVTCAAPNVSTIVPDAVLRELVCAEKDQWPETGSIPEDYQFHFHVPRRSTRGVEIGWTKGAFAVRFLTLASPEDFELGMGIIERVATAAGANVEPEDAEAMEMERLRAKYDTAWLRRTNELGLSAIQSTIQRKDASESVQIPGPRRAVQLGRRTLAELNNGGTPETALDRLLDLMRQVQFADLDDAYFAANVMEVTPPNGGKPVTLAAWDLGCAYLFPAVKYLMIVQSEHLMVPFSALEAIAGDRVRRIDESQALVESFEPAERDEVLARAKTHAVDLAVDRSGGNRFGEPKRWWQFWK